MKILDGKALAVQIQDEVKTQVQALAEFGTPHITLVQVGDDPASSVYVKTKSRMSQNCGIDSENLHLSAEIEQRELTATLERLSADARVHGVLLQLPLPPHLDADRSIAAIAPAKDVDGFHPENLGLLLSGKPRFVPCTPLGIRELLVRNGVDIVGANVVIVGRSIIVGKPLALLLSLKGKGGDASVTMCHSRTRDIASYTRSADIVICAMGRAGFLRGDMVRDGVAVVDVGINRLDDPSVKKGYRIVGDVDFEGVAAKSSYITPVPGGVGPMTVAMLMANTLAAFKLQTPSTNAI